MALEALDRVARPDERERAELLLALGEAESLAGNTSEAKRALLEAAATARRAGLPQLLARAAAEFGGRIIYARAGDDERLLPLLEEGLAALADEDVELRIRLLARLAAAHRDEPSRDRREALGREAVALARRTGDAAGLAYALDGLVMTIRGPDTVQECVAIGRELSEVAHRLGDKERQAAGLMHRVGPLLTLARVSEAAAHVDASARLPASSGERTCSGT